MDIVYDICVGATLGLYSGAIVYVTKKIIEEDREKRRLKVLDKGLNFFADSVESSEKEFPTVKENKLEKEAKD